MKKRFGWYAAAPLMGAALLWTLLWSSVVQAQAPIIDLSDTERARSGGSGGDGGDGDAQQGGNAGELLYQLQMLQQEVMTLRGLVEQQANELQQLRQQSLDRYVELDRRVSALQGGEPVSAAAAEGSGSARGESLPQSRPRATRQSSEPSSANRKGEYEAYKNAYAKVKAQEFSGAVEAFQQFLEDYPEGDYAPNAHYWLGELYLVLTPPQPDKAQAAFTRLLQDYPGHAKVPDAMFKLGRMFYERGEQDRSRQLLEQVVAEYKQRDSSAVVLAQQFLDQNF